MAQTRVHEQHVQAAERLDMGVDGRLHRLEVAHVADLAAHLPGGGALTQAGRRRLNLVPFAAGDGHPVARLQQRLGGGIPDALAAARDKCTFARRSGHAGKLTRSGRAAGTSQDNEKTA